MSPQAFDAFDYRIAKAEALGTEWMADAACRNMDTNLWFPERGYEASASVAKKVCWTQCPVRAQCEEYSLVAELKHGIYGGRSEKERRLIRRRRRVA